MVTVPLDVLPSPSEIVAWGGPWGLSLITRAAFREQALGAGPHVYCLPWPSDPWGRKGVTIGAQFC